MSEDTPATADLGDLGSRGERRRALQAERERQAQRQDERDREAQGEAVRDRQAQGEADGRQPDEQAPPLIRPYEVTLQGQETALLVAGGSKASDADGGASGAAGQAGRPVPPIAHPAVAGPLGPDAELPRRHAPDGDAPADDDLSAPLGGDGGFLSATGPQPRVAALPFDLPPFALPSDPQPSQWSAFTPVIPPEPLRFDEAPPAAWERQEPQEPWTSPATTPASGSPMPGSPAPGTAAVEQDPAVASEAGADDTVWTVPTPEGGVALEPAEPQETADERQAEWADDVTGSAAAATDEADPAEDSGRPLTPAPGWSADLSRVELFRSALEDLGTPPGEGAASHEEDLFSSDSSTDFSDDATREPAPLDPVPLDAGHDDRPPTDERSAEELPAEDLWLEDLPAEEPGTGELPTVEPRDDAAPADELPTAGRVAQVPRADEPSDENAREDGPADTETPTDESAPDEAPRDELTDEGRPEPPSGDDNHQEEPSPGRSPGRSLAELLGGRPGPERRADEAADDERRTSDVAPDQPTPGPPSSTRPAPPRPPAPAPAHPEEPAASLPPLGRQPFGRAPTQRLAEALAHGEGPHLPEDDEPLRGTVAPVLRRSTERVRYPTSTMPVIRPPVMPPTPGSGIAIMPLRSGTVTWQQALAGDVLPQGKKPRRGTRVSKPRHVSGGVGEYRPKVAADRSLTLLVVAMLLVLAGLVAAAVWTFWPHLFGAPTSLPVLGVPRAVSGP